MAIMHAQVPQKDYARDAVVVEGIAHAALSSLVDFLRHIDPRAISYLGA